MIINSVAHERDHNDFKEGNISATNVSCGVGALYGHPFQTEEEIKACVDRVLKLRKRSDRFTKEAFIVFSDIDHSHPEMKAKMREDCNCSACRGNGKSGGMNLAEYIKNNKIGYIVETPAEYNPNSGNWIKVWVWHPPHDLSSPDKTLPKEGWMRYFTKEGRFVGSFNLAEFRNDKDKAERIKYYETMGYTVKE